MSCKRCGWNFLSDRRYCEFLRPKIELICVYYCHFFSLLSFTRAHFFINNNNMTDESIHRINHEIWSEKKNHYIVVYTTTPNNP